MARPRPPPRARARDLARHPVRASARALAPVLVLAVALVLVAVPAPVAAPHVDEVQVEDPAGDVEGPAGGAGAAAGAFADLRAVWVSDETADEISFHVEVELLPPRGPEAVTDPFWVQYVVNFTFHRPAVPGAAGFEEPVRRDHGLVLVAANGPTTNVGWIIVGEDVCSLDGGPGTASRSDADQTLTCTLSRDRLLPGGSGTFYEGDALVDFDATGRFFPLVSDTLDTPDGFVDSAVGDGAYAFQVVEPAPEPAAEDEVGEGDGAAGGGAGGGGGPGADDGDGPGSGPGDEGGGTGAGPTEDDGSAGGEATPGPGAAALVAAMAAGAAVSVLRGRRGPGGRDR